MPGGEARQASIAAQRKKPSPYSGRARASVPLHIPTPVEALGVHPTPPAPVPNRAPYRAGAAPEQVARTAAPPRRDPRVVAVQTQLQAMGWGVDVDGVMGPKTRKAIELSHNGTVRNAVHHPDHAAVQARRQVQREQRARAVPPGGIQHHIQYTPIYEGQKPTGTAGAFMGPDGRIYLPGHRPPPGARITQVPYYKEDRVDRNPALHSILGNTTAEGQQARLEAYRAQNEPSPILTGALKPLEAAVGANIVGKVARGEGVGAGDVVSTAGNLATLGLPVGEGLRGAALIASDIKAATTAEGVTARALATLREVRGGRALDATAEQMVKRDVAAKRAVDALPIYSPEREQLRKTLQQSGEGRKDIRATMTLWDNAARSVAEQAGVTPEQAYAEMVSHAQYHDINATAQTAGDIAKSDTFQRTTWATLPTDLKGVPTFVSKLYHVVSAMPEKVGVEELAGKLKSAGVKQDEIKWSRFDTFLKSQPKKSITKQEALAWLDNNYLMIEENRRFIPGNDMYAGADADSDYSKFGAYALPGAHDANYQEFTIRLPSAEYGYLYAYPSHFPDPNILAHVRTTDRTIGEDRALMIEEIQSDWHQAGQKQGYKMPVEEHPDFQALTQSLTNSQNDVASIANKIRQTITDSVFSHPELPGMPESLRPVLQASGEDSIGLNLTNIPDVDQWLNKYGRFDEALRENPSAHAEVVASELQPGFYVGVNGRVIDGPWYQTNIDDSSSVERLANKVAVNWNRVFDMRPADRDALVSHVEAYKDALREQAVNRGRIESLRRVSDFGVSDAPFQKTWHELAFKRMLAEAVDKGYDRVAWTTGRTQAERYDLANFFKRIEIKLNLSHDETYRWADEMAQDSVESMSNEELGIDESVLEELQQRAEAEHADDRPQENDFYFKHDPNGHAISVAPDDPEAQFAQESFDIANEEHDAAVSNTYDKMLQSTVEAYRESMYEAEREYYVENVNLYEHEDDGNGSLTVHATDHNGDLHTYDATPIGSGYDDALDNIIGPDLARQYSENGTTTFEGENLMAGENTQSAMGAQHFYDNKLTGFVNKYLKQTGVKSEKRELTSGIVYKVVEASYSPSGSSPGWRYVVEAHHPNGGVSVVDGRATEEEAQSVVSTLQEYERQGKGQGAAGTVVHSIPITDEVRAFVDQGLALFQRDSLVNEIRKSQGMVKGAVNLKTRELHLFRGADVTTPVHELGHIIQVYAQRTGLDPEEFARSFEQYVIKGDAPTKATDKAFNRLSAVMSKVYADAHVPGEALSPEVAQVFDEFFQRAAKVDPNLTMLMPLHEYFQQDDKADPLLEAAAMQVTQGGMSVEDSAKMFGVEPDALRLHIEGGAHESEQARILSNEDVGAGPAETTGNVQDIFDKWHLQDAGFVDDAQRVLGEAAAMARDVGRTMPSDEWPTWVKNNLRAQGLLHENGTWNAAEYVARYGQEGEQPPIKLTPKDEAASIIERLRSRQVDMSPRMPSRTKLRRLPGESDAELASRQAAAAQDYLIRKREWDKNNTFPEDWLFQEDDFPPVDENLANTHEPVSDLSPAEQIRRGTAGARSMYGKQKKMRSEEFKRRTQEAEKALRSITDPVEAQAAARAAMRGQMPQIDWNGLTTLDEVTLRELQAEVNQREDLLTMQKINLNEALNRAVFENRIPAPAEMRLIEQVFGKKSAIGIAQHAAGGWGDVLINILNIPRSLMATADLSAVGRQSLVAGASHPILWGKAWPTMIRSMRSGEFYDAAQQEIKDDPLYNLALAAHISFTDIGEGSALAAHEEAFQSDYAAKALDLVPGVPNVIKGSARAYIGFLNKLRMDMFKQQIRIAMKAGRDVHDEEFLTAIGKVINAATGRGSMPASAEHIMPALNTFLFSPRLMLSRINYLDPTWYYRLGRGLDKGAARQVRKEALRGLFMAAGAVSSTLFLFSHIPGVDIGSLDPRSADFGKLKIGNTRIDLAGGFQQYMRLAVELATNTSVSTTTGRKQTLGSGYGVPTAFDVVVNFAVNKLSPAAGIAVATLRQKDAVGNPAGLRSIEGIKNTAVSNFTPLIVQDANDIYNEKHGGVNGILWALGGYGIGSVGLGIQTYKAKDPGAAAAKKMIAGAKEAGLPTPPKDVLLDLTHKANLDAISQQHPSDNIGKLKDSMKYYTETTNDHSYDAVAKKIIASKDAKSAHELYMMIRSYMIGPGVSQYDRAIKAATGG